MSVLQEQLLKIENHQKQTKNKQKTMCKSKKEVSQFSLEGEIQEAIAKDGKLKYLKIATSERLELVKLSKELRKSFPPIAIPGSVVRVSGEKKLDPKTGKVKLKADSQVLVSKSGATADGGVVVEADFGAQKSAPSQKKAKILVCQKSDCNKRGAGGVCKALEAALSDRGLAEQVTIQKTGCLKQCKAGPNIVMLPNKERYSKIDPQEIPELIEKHFAS